MMNLRHSLKRRLGRSKVSLGIEESFPDITDPTFHAAMKLCRECSMTSVERLHALFAATRYIVDAQVPGAFIECGVWKGGSVMMMAATLKAANITDRDIYLFDTFTGMPEPDDKDVDYAGTPMREVTKTKPNWMKAGMDEVRANIARTDYPMARFHFVPGDVLVTLPSQAPPEIALLRLDTDWYKSTAHELAHLFPRLARRGVLIIDDYGHFRGAREAVDDFLGRQPERYLLQRIDYSGRLMIKA